MFAIQTCLADESYSEVVGQLGMFGFLICGAQAAGLEHEGMKTATWNGATSQSRCFLNRLSRLTRFTVGLILAYTAGKCSMYPSIRIPVELMVLSLAMFILYTVAPLLYRMASSAYYNLSLLSSDWYGLIIGVFTAQTYPHLYS